MPGFWIKNGTDLKGLKVFVSAYTNGRDDWYDLQDDFKDYEKSHWNRNGWEVIVVKNPSTGERRGWYMQTLDAGALECTFMGFDQDLALELNMDR
ncbi:hypothetical protein CVT24_004966 [Panaeolus cyanescens]|uniref:Uncharacterized protein n=1 Tax=Panaeolus cyanescens TaxID=181874 RepID=A0A409YB50_9AGAR|nr:hypothetical protein CVT24_004966 [Panaeolus cyanescens]